MDGDRRTDGAVAPLPVRLRFGRAAVQIIADGAGVDLLHIKGEVVDRSLDSAPAAGSDIDALVRPAHVGRLDTALRAHGWRIYSSFTYGSPFEHAQTYLHDLWGFFDLHRSFPGIYLSADEAFELMWRDRMGVSLAGADAFVPSVPMQATVLILNAARANRQDAVQRWVVEPGLDPDVITDCVDRLRAQVAYAAATGRLADFRHRPEYLLWRVVTQGGSRTAEWWGRIRAAGSMSERLRIAIRAPRVNTEQLQHALGRQPTRREVWNAAVGRQALALREMASLKWRGRGDDV